MNIYVFFLFLCSVCGMQIWKQPQWKGRNVLGRVKCRNNDDILWSELIKKNKKKNNNNNNNNKNNNNNNNNNNSNSFNKLCDNMIMIKLNGNNSCCRYNDKYHFLVQNKKIDNNYKRRKKKEKNYYMKRLKSLNNENGFSNTYHNDVKKNTLDYSEERLPSYHRYIDNLKTRKIIHPSIRIRDLDKKFMKCKESYNKLYSHLKENDLFENFSYVGRQRKGLLSPTYRLPKYIERPNYHRTGTPVYVPYDNEKKKNKNNNNNDNRYDNIKSDKDIEIIKENCRFARELMDDISYIICEGITTNDIDIYILNKCINNGFYPSPLNYHNFPKSSCISINEILCHGIPDNNLLYLNDIVKIDISLFRNGYHADMCESFVVPKLSKSEKKKRKKYYDFIYLNNSFRTKYTKYILKYHYDLTKNKIVRKGKSFVTKKIKYASPNSKEQNNPTYNHDFDDNTTNVNISQKSYFNDIYREKVPTQASTLSQTHNENNLDSMDNMNNYYNDNPIHNSESTFNIFNNDVQQEEDELEYFHKYYDKEIIFNEEKNEIYQDIQKFIYQKSLNKKVGNKRFDFFDNSKMNINDIKNFMYQKNLDLIKTAYECTMVGISVCKDGIPFKKIAEAMDNYIKDVNKKKNKTYSIVPHLCGHNIGKNFHEEPYIIHTLNNDERKMCSNMVFTIEPIISESSPDFILWPDNWTISNTKYHFSAQFEHTILIQKNGAQILTDKMDTSPKYLWQQIY
ncbi:methionine aminopeptidase 1c, putative [Plasmodium sp. gorilla clade G3]|nr:methionine aminopeptidase 1c, putative [Plasmodium sp. gorilla clade G3]